MHWVPPQERCLLRSWERPPWAQVGIIGAGCLLPRGSRRLFEGALVEAGRVASLVVLWRRGGLAKDKLARKVLVVWLQRHGKAHVLPEEVLRGELAAVHADGGAPGLLQVAAPLDLHPRHKASSCPSLAVLCPLVHHLHLVQGRSAHQPLAGQRGHHGVHRQRELGKGPGEHRPEGRRQPTGEEGHQHPLRNSLHFVTCFEPGV
mmetsp:Transcript_6768/g.17493  ORF Transcript_6768/g.17493 Transcript_6768/m.17493 type:complete len:204 (-) Transcript_6768:88-699(-)